MAPARSAGPGDVEGAFCLKKEGAAGGDPDGLSTDPIPQLRQHTHVSYARPEVSRTLSNESGRFAG